MRQPPTIIECMENPRLFGPMFEGESWDHWKAILRGAYGLPMSTADQEFFRFVCGREPPGHRVRELDIISGRRSGKDAASALMVSTSALTYRPNGKVRPGERPLCLLLGADKEQARNLLQYVKAMFAVPALAKMVQRRTQDGFELTNGCDVFVGVNDYRLVRGRTVLIAVLNELSFWPSGDSASSP